MTVAYMAARYSRLLEMREKRVQLEALGWRVNSRWLDYHGGRAGEESRDASAIEADMASAADFALEDLDDVRSADVLIFFAEHQPGAGKGGRHTEFGIALGSGRRIITVGPRENVFHALPTIIHFPSWEEFLEDLEQARRSNGHTGPTRRTPTASKREVG